MGLPFRPITPRRRTIQERQLIAAAIGVHPTQVPEYEPEGEGATSFGPSPVGLDPRWDGQGDPERIPETGTNLTPIGNFVETPTTDPVRWLGRNTAPGLQRGLKAVETAGEFVQGIPQKSMDFQREVGAELSAPTTPGRNFADGMVDARKDLLKQFGYGMVEGTEWLLSAPEAAVSKLADKYIPSEAMRKALPFYNESRSQSMTPYSDANFPKPETAAGEAGRFAGGFADPFIVPDLVRLAKKGPEAAAAVKKAAQEAASFTNATLADEAGKFRGYHGTPRSFEKFQTSGNVKNKAAGYGTYLAGDKQGTKAYTASRGDGRGNDPKVYEVEVHLDDSKEIMSLGDRIVDQPEILEKLNFSTNPVIRGLMKHLKETGGLETIDGGGIYGMLERQFDGLTQADLQGFNFKGNDPAEDASRALFDSGIYGHKYSDLKPEQMTGDPIRDFNFVIYEDDPLQIVDLERLNRTGISGVPTMGGLAGAGVGAAAGAAASEDHPVLGAIAGGALGGAIGARGAKALNEVAPKVDELAQNPFPDDVAKALDDVKRDANYIEELDSPEGLEGFNKMLDDSQRRTDLGKQADEMWANMMNAEPPHKSLQQRLDEARQASKKASIEGDTETAQKFLTEAEKLMMRKRAIQELDEDTLFSFLTDDAQLQQLDNFDGTLKDDLWDEFDRRQGLKDKDVQDLSRKLGLPEQQVRETYFNEPPIDPKDFMEGRKLAREYDEALLSGNRDRATEIEIRMRERKLANIVRRDAERVRKSRKVQANDEGHNLSEVEEAERQMAINVDDLPPEPKRLEGAAVGGALGALNQDEETETSESIVRIGSGIALGMLFGGAMKKGGGDGTPPKFKVEDYINPKVYENLTDAAKAEIDMAVEKTAKKSRGIPKRTESEAELAMDASNLTGNEELNIEAVREGRRIVYNLRTEASALAEAIASGSAPNKAKARKQLRDAVRATSEFASEIGRTLHAEQFVADEPENIIRWIQWAENTKGSPITDDELDALSEGVKKLREHSDEVLAANYAAKEEQAKEWEGYVRKLRTPESRKRAQENATRFREEADRLKEQVIRRMEERAAKTPDDLDTDPSGTMLGVGTGGAAGLAAGDEDMTLQERLALVGGGLLLGGVIGKRGIDDMGDIEKTPEFRTKLEGQADEVLGVTDEAIAQERARRKLREEGELALAKWVDGYLKRPGRRKAEAIKEILRERNVAIEDMMQELVLKKKATFLQKAATFMRANKLTLPAGRIRDLVTSTGNFASEAAQAPLRLAIENVLLATPMHKKRAEAAGYARRTTDSSVFSVLESEGWKNGWKEAMNTLKLDMPKGSTWRDWVAAIRRADIKPEDLAKLETPFIVNFDTPALDFYTKLVYRATTVPDKLLIGSRVAPGVAFRQAISELAGAEARQLGLHGKDRIEYIKTIMQFPPQDMLSEAAVIADRITFRSQRGMAGRVLGAMNGVRGKNPNIGAVIDMFVPFVRAAADITDRATDYALGFPKGMYDIAQVWSHLDAASIAMKYGDNKAYAEAIKEAAVYQRSAIERMSRQAVGSFVVWQGYEMAKDGRLAGSFQFMSNKDKDDYRRRGAVSNSMLFGDQWIPLSQLAPGGSALLMGATLYHLQKNSDPNFAEMVGNVALSAARTALDQPLAATTNQFIESVNSSEGVAGTRPAQLFGGLLAGQVPSAVSGLARAIDPYRRETPDAGSRVLARIPFASMVLPKQVTQIGDVRRMHPEGRPLAARLTDMFNPFAGGQAIDTPATRALSENEAVINDLGFNKNRYEDRQEYLSEREVLSRRIGEKIDEVLQTPEYLQPLEWLEEQSQLEGFDAFWAKIANNAIDNIDGFDPTSREHLTKAVRSYLLRSAAEDARKEFDEWRAPKYGPEEE